jgi:hypothetical protein
MRVLKPDFSSHSKGIVAADSTSKVQVRKCAENQTQQAVLLRESSASGKRVPPFSIDLFSVNGTLWISSIVPGEDSSAHVSNFGKRRIPHLRAKLSMLFGVMTFSGPATSMQ